MKTILLLAPLLVSVAYAGETKLKVTGPDGLDGTAVMSIKLQEDGSKTVRLTMKLKYGSGQTADVLQESSYSAKGEPVRMLQTSRSMGKKTSITVTFTSEGAQVVTDRGDGPKTNLVVRPKGTTADPSVMWFVRDTPERGQSTESYTFRVSEQTWQKTKTRYEGKKEIVVTGHKVNANLVVAGEFKAFVDDKGDPYRFEIGSLTLERSE
ncbi:MAG: hypothetical protein JSS66_18750 [Armatimonadetes bacterium]|nr:hypothetical protein [Armatimonadota bacterium]